jgi:hypothetical protein
MPLSQQVLIPLEEGLLTCTATCHCPPLENHHYLLSVAQVKALFLAPGLWRSDLLTDQSPINIGTKEN